MNIKKSLSLWGLKWNRFSPEVPAEALWVTPRLENFTQRVEQLVQEGGFALISGVAMSQCGTSTRSKRVPCLRKPMGDSVGRIVPTSRGSSAGFARPARKCGVIFER